jgi:hypothetical protein
MSRFLVLVMYVFRKKVVENVGYGISIPRIDPNEQYWSEDLNTASSVQNTDYIVLGPT